MNTNTTSPLMDTLRFALHTKRPHGGAGERNLLAHVLTTTLKHAPHLDYAWRFDAVGNLHIDARTDHLHRTLFVAHTDTVHREDGPNAVRITDTHWHAEGSQLGADNGAGVAVVVHMLAHTVPGYYLFTVGEECGGIGATHVASAEPALLQEFDRAVTFDRRGVSSVVTHQAYGRCASDAFAEALSAQLSTGTLLYMPDDTGVYTDTAEFVEFVPECTNISVGYEWEHSTEESLDITHLLALADTVLDISWDDLPTERVPGEDEIPATAWGGHPHTTYGAYGRSDAFLTAEDEAMYDALQEWTEGSAVFLTALLVATAEDEYGAVCTADELRPVVDRALAQLTEETATQLMQDLLDAVPAHIVADEILSPVIS